MVRQKRKKLKKSDRVPISIVSLIINMLILPGLGSIIGGKIKEGIWQLILFIGSIAIGILLIISIVGIIPGILLIIFGALAAWIWALISGIQLVQEASR